MFLLDTNACIRILNGSSPALAARLQATSPAEEAGLMRLDLERSGRPVGPNDLLIAATARAYDLALVTHNVREFGRVSGLRIDDWETAGSASRP